MLDDVLRLLDGLTVGGRARDLSLRCELDGYRARLTNRLDDETAAFEDELLARELPGPPPRRLELSVFQRHMWARGAANEHRVFQLRDAEGRPAMQIMLRIERPRRMPLFGRAIAHELGPGVSVEAEWVAVRALRRLACEAGDLVSLRLAAYRRDQRELRDFDGRVSRVGYRIDDPVGVTRTLIVDLTRSSEELLAWMSKKTRAKIRHKARGSVIIRDLDGPRWTAACRAAVNASLSRTQGGTARFDFAGAFDLLSRHPERVKALGVFLPQQPDELLAYVIGVRHGEMAEYVSAGSLDHAVLRTMPFNYWLLWELSEWARAGGARWLDLGGVTDGGPGDSRAGISDFKRRFTDLDEEPGREFITELQPARSFALTLWSETRSGAQERMAEGVAALQNLGERSEMLRGLYPFARRPDGRAPAPTIHVPSVSGPPGGEDEETPERAKPR